MRNIDLKEMYDNLSYSTREKLTDLLHNDGYIKYDSKHFNYPTPIGIEDEDVVNSLNSLLKGRHLLSAEDRQSLITLAGKL